MNDKAIAEALDWILAKLNRKKWLIRSIWERELKGE